MHTCPLSPLLRGARKSRGNVQAVRAATTTTPALSGSTRARRALAVSITLTGWAGWRALHDLLSAIPDSNDDFGLF